MFRLRIDQMILLTRTINVNFLCMQDLQLHRYNCYIVAGFIVFAPTQSIKNNITATELKAEQDRIIASQKVISINFGR